jgi:hypothetical protein
MMGIVVGVRSIEVQSRKKRAMEMSPVQGRMGAGLLHKSIHVVICGLECDHSTYYARAMLPGGEYRKRGRAFEVPLLCLLGVQRQCAERRVGDL